MKNILGFSCVLLLIISACNKPAELKDVHHISFMAADSVNIFAEGIISTKYNVRDFTLSPTGDELYFSLQHPQSGFTMIMGSKKVGELWTKPETAPFSGNFSDFEASFSPDGKRLYFASNRPLDDTGKTKDFDIWYVEKNESGWDKPKNMGAPINTNQNEFYPSVASNGNVYFTANREAGVGREDIFVSRFEDGAYLEPVPLDTAVNSEFDEFNAFVSPEEDFIIFSSWGRQDDMGRSDLYISFKDSLEQWQSAKHLGPKINSNYIDYCPFVSADQKYFFFTSARFNPELFQNNALYSNKFDSLMQSPLNGSTNIYLIDFQELLRLSE